MKGFFSRFSIATLFLLMLLVGSAFAVSNGETVRVGLSYGSNALPSANLENSDGTGYRFGYYTDADAFVTLGSTEATQISMLKTQNLYLSSNGAYVTSSAGSVGLVGCYHVQLPGSYGSFEEAKAKAATVNNGFPAWVSGTYYVRSGSYATEADAQRGMGALGIAGTSVVGTTSYGISVTQTKTSKILFQYDVAGGAVFAVKPGSQGSNQTKTWFKGNKYAGSFLYERIGGGNLTVVNFLPMDDYIKGIVPYEMSSSWPTEALKAQAVCAKSYLMSSVGNKHANYHFDVCNTTCCQAYQGAGRATAGTDAAVDAVSGIYARYNGEIAKTFYYASNGGATEDCANVWSANLPYLKGKTDPYEADIANKVKGYYWTKTYTSAELTARLQSKGYSCGAIVACNVSQFTPAGNVYSVTAVDDAGKSIVLNKEKAKLVLGVSSLHFTMNGGSGGGNATTDRYYVDGVENSLSRLDGVWALGANGEAEQMKGSSGHSVLTSAGTSVLPAVGTNTSTAPAGTFVISGAGNGHNVGMSQWGAYAMANRGYTYDEILKFYYTGIDLY